MAEPKIASVTIAAAIPPGSTSIFNPTTQTINLNDSVFWANETNEEHQPAPDGGKDNQWLTQPIPAKKSPEAPAPTSPQVVFDSTPSGKTTSFPYHCATHPTRDKEKGVITVNVAS